METIVQMYSQLLVDATPEKVKADLIPEKVISMMRTSWETHGRAGTSWFNQQRATKLSAVKPAGNQPPQFQYQQQQCGEYLCQGHSTQCSQCDKCLFCGQLVQLVTASRLILYHEGRVDPMKDECHYQIKH